jgi:hypothetical protein
MMMVMVIATLDPCRMFKPGQAYTLTITTSWQGQYYWYEANCKKSTDGLQAYWTPVVFDPTEMGSANRQQWLLDELRQPVS